MRKFSVVLWIAMVPALAGPALAQFDYYALLQGTGHDERVDGGTGCPNEADFIAGVYDSVTQLQAGGDGYGCDSEWGCFAEFDFTAVEESGIIISATLIWRYTGYGDDAQGLPYLAVFGYEYADEPVILPRADLNDQTALSIFQPTSNTNVDIAINVTDFIIDLVDQEIFRTGFFLCGVFSEAGYNDLTYFGGSGHAFPPRLVISTTGPVQTEAQSWGAVKAVFR
jgi:hypothetical protein